MATDLATLALSQTQAKALAGKPWQLLDKAYHFADYDPRERGTPPWKSGAEGLAYPLLDSAGSPTAYVKFFDELRITPKRIDRTRWLVQQGIHTWTPELRGAPRLWIDTQDTESPLGINFDFSCSLADAVPGQTWLELKLEIAEGLAEFNIDLRRRCIANLIRGLAFLEAQELVHGDLSPNNILIDIHAADERPHLYIIDFDAFYAPQMPPLAALSAAEGGTFGTDGYCPPELAQRAKTAPASAAPFSDRYARDTLLLELICFDADCDYELPPTQWPPSLFRQKLRRSQLATELPYLTDDNLHQLSEADRPTSGKLARLLHVSAPPRIKRKRSFHPQDHADTFIEFCLRHVVLGLWALCVLHWTVVSFAFTGWLTTTTNPLTWAGSLLRLGTCVLLGVAGSMGGIAVTTMTAFAERQARVIGMGGFAFSLPARRNLYRSDARQRFMVIAQLAAMLVTLMGCAYLMATAHAG